MINFNIIIVIYFVINIISFVVFLFDKLQAKKNKFRIPEAILFLLMLYLGTLGGILGMLIFRHKIKKWYFWLSIPMFIFSNYQFYNFISKFIEK